MLIFQIKSVFNNVPIQRLLNQIQEIVQQLVQIVHPKAMVTLNRKNVNQVVLMAIMLKIIQIFVKQVAQQDLLIIAQIYVLKIVHLA